MTPQSKRQARKIPDIIRSTELLTKADPIGKAVAVAANPHMQLLFIVHYKYIEPFAKGDMSCSICLNRVLTSFKNMKEALLELEKEQNLLGWLMQD